MPVASVASPSPETYAVLIARKQLDARDQSGKQALELIDAAQVATPKPSPKVGTLLNIVA